MCRENQIYPCPRSRQTGWIRPQAYSAHADRGLSIGAEMKKSAAERFWNRVDVDGPIPAHMPHLGKCWLWIGHKNEKGYGHFFVDSKNIMPHRFSYELKTGTKIRPELLACHHCDTPACVNPDHIFIGTCGDNMRDAARKGRCNNMFKGRAACSRGHKYVEGSFSIHHKGNNPFRRCFVCQREREKAQTAARLAIIGEKP